MQLSSQPNRSNDSATLASSNIGVSAPNSNTESSNQASNNAPSTSQLEVVSSGLPRSISDTKIRQGRPNLTLPLPSVTSLMHFKVVASNIVFKLLIVLDIFELCFMSCNVTYFWLLIITN
jgi:hypothetical protein